MAVDIYYTLELFPTEGNYNSYVEWFGATEITRTDDNAGVDLYCVTTTKVSELQAAGSMAVLLDLGVKARMLKTILIRNPATGEEMTQTNGCHFWLAPRSSIWKSGVRQANSLGVIDKSYRGSLMGAVIANVDNAVVEQGSRLFQVLAPDMGHIQQIVLRPLTELDTTSRGEGGFGSTGK